MNSVSILFSWHKNFGRVIKRHSLLSFMKESSSLVRQTELKRIFNSSWHFMYRKLNSHACIYRLNLAAKIKKKNRERRPGLRFDRIHEKLNYPKRFTDNIEKKIRDDLFFLLKQ